MSEYTHLVCPKDCDLICLGEEGTLLFEKQHAYPGNFRMKTSKGPVDFELTEDALKQVAAESNRYIENGNKCNLPTKHTEETEANRGHNLKWFVKPDSKNRPGLFSLTEFRDKEAAKLAKTAQTSIYCPGKFEDGKKNEYIRPVRHVALTDYPVIPGLDGFTPIAASLTTEFTDSTDPIKKETIMPIKELAADIGLQLSEEILADEGKAFGAIADAFKEVQQTSGKQVKDITLELSEYKKLNPPKADPIRVSKAQISMLRENRELKLSALVEKGKILTCVKTKLEEVFCGDADLTLSLAEDKEDKFNEVIDALRDNDPIKLSEGTGPQGGDMSVLLDKEINPVIANAEKRRARAAG
jgi:hypothetical protein